MSAANTIQLDGDYKVEEAIADAAINPGNLVELISTGKVKKHAAMLGPRGIEVLEAAVPYGLGEKHCLHLQSFMSPLSDDPRRMVVDIEWLSVATVELLRTKGYELIPIDTAERETLAANVLALGGDRVIAIAANKRTNRRMAERGLEVELFEADEICINGSGGPTCLTRPLLRSQGAAD